LLTDLKLRCKAILVVSNSFFYNEDYENAARTSEASINLLANKDLIQHDNKDTNELVDLLAKSYMMHGLSLWLLSVPTQADDPDLLSTKALNLSKAETSFEQGLPLVQNTDSMSQGKIKSQFLERASKVRDAKEKCKEYIKRYSSKLNEDSNTYQPSSMSQLSGERSFRINKITNKGSNYQRQPLQSPEERPPSLGKRKILQLNKKNLRKISTNTDQFTDSRDRRTDIHGVYIKSGVNHQRPGIKRPKSGKQEAHSVELNKNELQEKALQSGLRKSISIKHKPSSDQIELESQTDQRSSPQTQKSNKYQLSDKDNSSAKRQKDNARKNSKSSISGGVASAEDIPEDEGQQSRVSSHEHEKEEQIIAMQRQIEELTKQKEMLEKMTLNKETLEKRMIEMFYQNIPMAWLQNQQMMMPQYQQGMYPGYPWRPPYQDQMENQMYQQGGNSSSLLPMMQPVRVPDHGPKSQNLHYMPKPGQSERQTSHSRRVACPTVAKTL
jgi:hypothetical protein